MESNRGNADPEGNSQEEPAHFVHNPERFFFPVLDDYIIIYIGHGMNNAGHHRAKWFTSSALTCPGATRLFQVTQLDVK